MRSHEPKTMLENNDVISEMVIFRHISNNVQKITLKYKFSNIFVKLLKDFQIALDFA